VNTKKQLSKVEKEIEQRAIIKYGGLSIIFVNFIISYFFKSYFIEVIGLSNFFEIYFMTFIVEVGVGSLLGIIYFSFRFFFFDLRDIINEIKRNEKKIKK